MPEQPPSNASSVPRLATPMQEALLLVKVMLTAQPCAGPFTEMEAKADAVCGPGQLSTTARPFRASGTQPASGPASTPPSGPPSVDPPSVSDTPPLSGGSRFVPPFVYEPQAQRETSARGAARCLIGGLFGRLEVRGKEGEDHLVEALLADQLLGEEGGQVIGGHLHRTLAEKARRGGGLRRSGTGGGSDQGRHLRRGARPGGLSRLPGDLWKRRAGRARRGGGRRGGMPDRRGGLGWRRGGLRRGRHRRGPGHRLDRGRLFHLGRSRGTTRVHVRGGVGPVGEDAGLIVRGREALGQLVEL